MDVSIYSELEDLNRTHMTLMFPVQSMQGASRLATRKAIKQWCLTDVGSGVANVRKDWIHARESEREGHQALNRNLQQTVTLTALTLAVLYKVDVEHWRLFSALQDILPSCRKGFRAKSYQENDQTVSMAPLGFLNEDVKTAGSTKDIIVYYNPDSFSIKKWWMSKQ